MYHTYICNKSPGETLPATWVQSCPSAVQASEVSWLSLFRKRLTGITAHCAKL